MAEPKTKQEYEERFHANQKVTGHGLDTTQHVPCPFCAEPDFVVHKILETESAYEKGAVCRACGRGMRAIFMRSAGGMSFEFVQTRGAAIPDFLPQIRRIEDQ